MLTFLPQDLLTRRQSTYLRDDRHTVVPAEPNSPPTNAVLESILDLSIGNDPSRLIQESDQSGGE